jgi:hypothetical protein
MMATPWAISLGVRLSIAAHLRIRVRPRRDWAGGRYILRRVRGSRSLFGCVAHIPFFCMPPALVPPWSPSSFCER